MRLQHRPQGRHSLQGLRNGLRALGALLLLMMLLGGIPALLSLFPNPLHSLPDLLAGDVPSSAVPAVCFAIAWLAWAQFAFVTVYELLATPIRTKGLSPLSLPPRLPGLLGTQQQWVRSLVLAIVVVSSASSLLHPAAANAVGTPGASGWAGGANPTPATSVSQQLMPHGQAARPAAQPRQVGQQVGHQSLASAPAASSTYTVPADGSGPATLWDIAQDKLGDGARWQEIWQINEGRQQPGGVTMTSASFLRPGWTVLVPTAVSERAGLPSAQRPNTALPEATRPGTDAGATDTADTIDDVDVTVRPGDTLSGIASEHGRPEWQSTWQANAGHLEPDGDRFTDPNLIRPGWTITLPGTPTPTAGGPAAAPVTSPPQAKPPTPQNPSPERATVTPPEVDQEPAPLHGLNPAAPAASADPSPAGWASAPTATNPERARPAHPAAGGQGDGSDSHDQGGSRDSSQHAGDGGHVGDAWDDAGEVAMTALVGGGGAMLAAGALLVLTRLRRRQFRERTLGRTVSSIPPELAPTERALLLRSPAGLPDVTWLDAALQQLVWATGAEGSTLPEVAAARLTPGSLELVLAVARTDAPAPCQADSRGLRWTVQRSGLDDSRLTDRTVAPDLLVVPPYPALVSVGYTGDGDHWLLDLERIGALSLTGDQDRCLDLARFLAAELAHNSWAQMLRVDLVGFGAELAPLERVTYHHDGAEAVRSLRRALRGNTDAMRSWDSTVLHGRVHRDDVGDGWPPRVLLVAPDAAPGEGADDLQALLEAMRAERGRTAVAVVVVGESRYAADTRWQLHIDANGVLSIPALDVVVTAQQVPVHEAANLAALVALAARGTDEAVPTGHGDQPWEALSDLAGAPRPELVVDRECLHHDADSTTSPATSPFPSPAAASLQTDNHTQRNAPAAGALPTPPRPIITNLLSRHRMLSDRPASGPAQETEQLNRDADPAASDHLSTGASSTSATKCEPTAPAVSGVDGDPAAVVEGVTSKVAGGFETGSDISAREIVAAGGGADKGGAVRVLAARTLGPTSIASAAGSDRKQGPATSVLPRPATAYLDLTATTVQDVEALAPTLPAEAVERIETSSRGLDADLAAWHDSSNPRAKLRVLGRVELTAPGVPPPNSQQRYAAIAAYLSTKPSGVTAAQLSLDFWPDAPDPSGPKVRNYLSHVRNWLGEDPETKQAYLPPANRDGGVAGTYRLNSRLLVDAELFRQLRLRGVARGTDGLADLRAALALVDGPPLQDRREEHYGWLLGGSCSLDPNLMLGMVVDVAHLAASISLQNGEPEGAEAAALIARRAGDTSDTALLDLVAAYYALGQPARAQAHVRMIFDNHDPEVEEDLPNRTYEVLYRHRWLPSQVG